MHWAFEGVQRVVPKAIGYPNMARRLRRRLGYVILDLVWIYTMIAIVSYILVSLSARHVVYFILSSEF